MRSGGNLPADLTTLVGRVREVRDVRAMLGRARLVSLTGTGGVGKTRVALAAARTAERAFPDGVWFIDLAKLRDAALVEATVTAALGEEQGRGSGGPAERIADWHALLVIDNCEHLLPACAALIRDVLQRAPQVRVLTTSREPIGLSGEHVLRLGPLDAPGDAELAPEALLATYESVQLLVDRAQAIQQDFAVTRTNAADVARLCRRLDGLPLTIELAAARLNTMSIRQIADRLDDQAAILTTGTRDAPGRQASLEDTITWSYELCSPGEQRLWARMSVFAGPVDAEAIETICAEPGEPFFDLLDGLVRKSIVTREQGELPRFYLLGAIRQYGRRRLDPAGDADLAVRHAAYYQRMALEAAHGWYTAEQLMHADRLRHALPDVRLALDHLLHGPAPDEGLAMAADLYTLWVCSGRLVEGSLWLERGLAATPPDAASYPRALVMLGWLQVAGMQSEAAPATLTSGHALAIERGQADVADLGAALLATADGFAGRVDAALARHSTALASRRAAGDDGAVGFFLMLQAEMHLAEGDLAASLRSAEESEQVCRRLGETWCRSYALWVGSLALCGGGDYAKATAAARGSLEMKIGLEDALGILANAEVLSWTLAGTGRWKEAAQLHGAIQPRGDRIITPLRGFEYLITQRAAWGRRIREALGPEAYAQAEQAGLAMSVEEIGQFAMAAATGGSERTVTTASGAARAPLTKRETEVAELVAEGLSNREIAGRLVISPRTAEVHVERILVKLGFRSRAQIAPWWAHPA